MFSKIASLLALVASANAHGYLSSPMSRTGLNAQVSPKFQSEMSELHSKPWLIISSPVQIHARNVPSSNLSQRGLTSTPQRWVAQVHADTTPGSPSTTTSPVLAGVRNLSSPTNPAMWSMCNGASTPMVTTVACSATASARIRLSSTNF